MCLQADTWPKKALVTLGVLYIVLVVLIPFFNVFIQVRKCCMSNSAYHACRIVKTLPLSTSA